MKNELWRYQMAKAQKTKIKDVVENEVDIKHTETNEIINENLDEENLRDRSEAIRNEAKKIDEIIGDMSKIEKETFLEAKLDDFGVPKNNQRSIIDDSTWKISDIIKDVGVFVVAQEVKHLDVKYKLSDLVPSEMVQNGIKQVVYKDYVDADEIAGYDDVIIGDFNQGIGLTTKENWKADKNIHKGYDILDTDLNDIAKTPALFIAMLHDLQLNVARPIAKRKYQYRLQLLANPFADLNKDGIDITSVEPDKKIVAKTLEGAMKELINHAETLQFASRNHTPNKNWIPAKFVNDLEYMANSMGDFTMIIPLNVKTNIKVDVKAGTFNLGEVAIPVEVLGLNYDQTFVEYGKITGIKNTETEFDVFLIEKGAVELIEMYSATKLTDTPKMKQVANQYVRLGSCVDKTKRIFRYQLKIGDAA